MQLYRICKHSTLFIFSLGCLIDRSFYNIFWSSQSLILCKWNAEKEKCNRNFRWSRLLFPSCILIWLNSLCLKVQLMICISTKLYFHFHKMILSHLVSSHTCNIAICYINLHNIPSLDARSILKYRSGNFYSKSDLCLKTHSKFIRNVSRRFWMNHSKASQDT